MLSLGFFRAANCYQKREKKISFIGPGKLESKVCCYCESLNFRGATCETLRGLASRARAGPGQRTTLIKHVTFLGTVLFHFLLRKVKRCFLDHKQKAKSRFCTFSDCPVMIQL